MRREVGRPASRACIHCDAAQISTSASQIVAMPCAAVPSTRTVTPPLRKSIGAVRRDLPRAKNGQVIKYCATRGAKRHEERRVGKERDSTGRVRWARHHQKK